MSPRAIIACAAVMLGLAAAPAAETLTLDDAIRLALQRNQTLKVSEYSPQIARANVLAEYGRFEPALTFRRSYSEGEAAITRSPLTTAVAQADSYSLGLGGATPWGMTYRLTATADNQRGTANRFTDNFETFGGVTITQPLLRGFGFGANLAGLRIAKADRGRADWLHRQTIINTVVGVVFAYNNLIQARENLRIAQFSRELAMDTLKKNEARNRAGANTVADVIQAKSTAASRDDTILLSEQTVRDRENELRQLIGETVFFVAGGALTLEPLVPAVPMTVDVVADLKRAYELRPDFQAARLGVARSRYSSAAAQHQLLPRVDFVGSYGYSGMDRDFGTARAQVRDQDVRSYSAGIEVTVPLTFAEGRGRARAAKLAVKQSEADLTRLETDIAIDVTSAAGQLETSRKRVETNRAALELARQSLDAEEKKISAGSGSTFLVLQAQNVVVQVERSYVGALVDERRAQANYELQVGTTLLNRGLRAE